jgi:hypothetical protein
MRRNLIRTTKSAAIIGVALFGLAGCSNNAPGVAPEPGGHTIGYRDTPEATKAPPVQVPVGTPVGQDGTSSYATPSNPLPPGGLTPAPPPSSPQPTVPGP